MSSNNLDLEYLHDFANEKNHSPPLLFIHGGFHGAWCWQDHFMPWFAARGFNCYAISLRDHGGSRRTGQHTNWTLADYVDDALWAVDKLDTKPILIGHSLGGSIAQKVAATGAFPGMVLLAPSPIGGSNRAAIRMMFNHPKAMVRAVISRDLSVALPAFLPFFLSDNLKDDERERIVARLDGQTSFKAAAAAFYTDPPKPRVTNMPVLVVSGEEDWSIPRYKNEKLARLYGGNHVNVPSAHDIMCDVNWETGAQRIYDWLLRL